MNHAMIRFIITFVGLQQVILDLNELVLCWTSQRCVHDVDSNQSVNLMSSDSTSQNPKRLAGFDTDDS